MAVHSHLGDSQSIPGPLGEALRQNGCESVRCEGRGVLKGKKYSFIKDPLKATENFPRTDLRFEGAIYGGSGVVQDGKIITSGVCANIERIRGLEGGTVKLTKAFIAAVAKK